ncbi:MAG: murein biosynthesis integral membrane protein MurJ [bacterium]
MFNRFFNSQTKTITFAAFLLLASAFLSRVLGLFRDRLLAGRFGAGEELDIYFAAFRIPDFIYAILIMGGVAVVFLPVFSEHFQKKEEEAWRFANNLLNCFLFFLVLLCGVLFFLAPLLVSLIAPGFSTESKELAVSLTRIMFLSPIFLGLSSIFSGILHYFNRFLVYSIAPIFYNLGIIFGIVFFVPLFGVKGLAFGVILGAVFHLLIQIPAVRISGYKYTPVFNFKGSGLRKVFKLMLPRTIGAAAYQINLIVVTAIASTLTAGSIAVFNFANNLQFFPIGLVGVSFAIAAFPALSRAWAEGIKEKFLEAFYSTFRQILFLIIPASLLMFLLRAQLVRIVLGTGEFGWLETRLTAACLGIFCLSIFAAGFFPFLARVFYSLQDTKTPVIIGMSSMLLNVALALLFTFFLKQPNFFQEFFINILKLQGIKNIAVIGLPLAFSISQVFQFFLLLLFLRKRISGLKFGEIFSSFKKIAMAAVLMGFSVYFSLSLTAEFISIQTFLGIFLQTAIAGGVGVFVYILITYLLKSPELKTIKSAITKS